MRDAGDVQHQPVRAVERDKRGVARASVGEAFERQGLRGGIGVAGDKRGMTRAGVGEGQTRRQSEPLGVSVDSDKPARVLLGRDDGECGGGRNVMRAPGVIGRKSRQPQGQKSPVRQTFAPWLAR